MASLDLWLDSDLSEDTAGWKQPLTLDFDRFEWDQHYAGRVSDHISRALENLARELEEIGTISDAWNHGLSIEVAFEEEHPACP